MTKELKKDNLTVKMEDIRELPINLLHFGYIPNDKIEKKVDALKKASGFYTFKTIAKKLNQLESEYGYNLTDDKNFLDQLEISTRLPPPPPKPKESIWDKVCDISEKNKEVTMTIFPSLIKYSGLQDFFSSQEYLTLFFPIDDAFKKFPQKTLSELSQNVKMSQSLVLGHVLNPHVITSSKLSDQKSLSLKSSSGKRLSLSFTSNLIHVNDHPVLKQDIPTSNGVIHVIDFLL